MLLIKEIHIRYFRSLYTVKLDKLRPLTVIFGRNDSGKSNILRALNLFFNGFTNPAQRFVFERDLCQKRREEAASRTDARKFVSVRIVFNTPENWERSLGSSFWVKKTWSTTRDLEPALEDSLPASAKRQYLTRFLNRVRFYYIPAVKDRTIFEDLLAEVYSALSGNRGFVRGVEGFSQGLRDTTKALSLEFRKTIGIHSEIAPPQDLADLFRSLDFETGRDQGLSLKLQRGDGIQMRHLPPLLAFLSDAGGASFHIWGFEEPENSLEIANAVKEAEVLLGYSLSPNKQVFVTSHSPAFYGLEDNNVRKFFVTKVGEGAQAESRVRVVEGEGRAVELMGEAEHLAVLSAELKRLRAREEELGKQMEELEGRLVGLQEPVIFLEGDTDAVVFSAAWETYCRQVRMPRFEVIRGASNMMPLAADVAITRLDSDRRLVFALVDDDDEGRRVLKMAGVKEWGDGKWRQGKSGVFWASWPNGDDLVRVMGNLGVQRDKWPGCLENVFSLELRARAREEGVICEEGRLSPCLRGDVFPRVEDLLVDRGNPDREVLLTLNHQDKKSFAEWVARADSERAKRLAPLRELVTGLEEIIAASK